MPSTTIILRNEKRQNDSRYLAASYNDDGDLLITGHDLGDGVQAVFGSREYEWVWTIRAGAFPALKKALGNTDDLLQSLKLLFSNENAANLSSFLAEHQIAYESWSRIGD